MEQASTSGAKRAAGELSPTQQQRRRQWASVALIARSRSPSRRGSLRARCVDALRLAPATYYYSRTRGRGHERREHNLRKRRAQDAPVRRAGMQRASRERT